GIGEGEDASVAPGGAGGVGDPDAAPLPRNAQTVIGRARHGEGALPEGEGALRHLDRADRLGDEEVQIQIALTVDVRPLVERNPVHGDLEIGAMAGVEAAQKELVSLPLAPVLDEGKSRGGAEEVLCVPSGEEEDLLLA